MDYLERNRGSGASQLAHPELTGTLNRRRPMAPLWLVPAGLLIAAVVWMLPSAKRSEALVIILFTWLIAAGDFTHVIAGSTEIFALVVIGELGPLTAFSHHILPVLVGNVIGGTGLFAMLAYGQIRREM